MFDKKLILTIFIKHAIYSKIFNSFQAIGEIIFWQTNSLSNCYKPQILYEFVSEKVGFKKIQQMKGLTIINHRADFANRIKFKRRRSRLSSRRVLIIEIQIHFQRPHSFITLIPANTTVQHKEDR